MEKVTITIEMGNEAMQDVEHLAHVLTILTERIWNDWPGELQGRRLFDANGNAVGELVVE